MRRGPFLSAPRLGSAAPPAATIVDARSTGTRKTSPEGLAYDDITRRAAELCAVPVAVIAVIDGEHQLFRSRVGTDIASRPRELTFCTHALQDPDRIPPSWRTRPLTRGSRPTRW